MVHVYFEEKPLVLAAPQEWDGLLARYPNSLRIAEPPLFGQQWDEIVNALQDQGTDAAVIRTEDPNKTLSSLGQLYTPVQAAGGVVEAEGAVLLIFRRGKWDLPKGKRDEGEDLETCALREIEEETGLSHLRLMEKLPPTYHTYQFKGIPTLKESHWYRIAGDRSESLRPQADEDIEECRWVAKAALGDFLPLTHASLRPLLERIAGEAAR